MEWTNEDREYLLKFKDAVDSDDVKIKEGIKKILLQNKYIVHVLNNKELEEADSEPEDYFGVNILPYYIINPTQHNVQNFVCYEVSYKDIDRYNSAVKQQTIIFYVLCEQRNNKDLETGIARHDLLAALIQDQFNNTNYFGNKLTLVSDVAGVVDGDYASRTLTFEQRTDNNLIRTQNGISKFSNKEIRTLEKP